MLFVEFLEYGAIINANAYFKTIQKPRLVNQNENVHKFVKFPYFVKRKILT